MIHPGAKKTGGGGETRSLSKVGLCGEAECSARDARVVSPTERRCSSKRVFIFLGVCGEAELFGGWGEGHAGHVPTE